MKNSVGFVHQTVKEIIYNNTFEMGMHKAAWQQLWKADWNVIMECFSILMKFQQERNSSSYWNVDTAGYYVKVVINFLHTLKSVLSAEQLQYQLLWVILLSGKWTNHYNLHLQITQTIWKHLKQFTRKTAVAFKSVWKHHI